MKVFKFGGASVKNADAIRNMSQILMTYNGKKLVVVISAMDKTTNALEGILHARMRNENISEQVKKVSDFHLKAIPELFPDGNPELQSVVQYLMDKLNTTLETHDQLDYNKFYDAVVSTGEYLSSAIVCNYLNSIGFISHWMDASKFIRTDASYREGIVNWRLTGNLIRNSFKEILNTKTVVTQGFIGGTEEGQITTLGREGSDYTAAIIASALEAESVTIWKDVPGILNADPKKVPGAVLFPELPYTEASEMTYYGASVIHPKTIKPLANKKIPLYVKSFDHPDEPGTIIHKCKVTTTIPTIIFKENQCLFSFKVLDFTFVNEENLSKIFHELHELNIRINMMQNSAISFSVVFDFDPIRVDLLKERLRDNYTFLYNKNLTLITIKNSNEQLEKEYSGKRKIYLMQRSRKNVRYLVAEKS
ncbi:MAG TPA: aspartate kinase [Cyclobacteriaceae bacterium]